MKIFKTISSFLIIATFFILPTFVSADTPTKVTPTPVKPIVISLGNPIKCDAPGECDTLMQLIVIIIQRIVMPIASVAVVVWIILAGFAFVKAQGNSTEIAKAKERLLWSLIGGGIVLGAYGISQVVQNTIKEVIG